MNSILLLGLRHACALSELSPASIASEKSQSRKKSIQFEVSYWPWSECKPTQNSTPAGWSESWGLRGNKAGLRVPTCTVQIHSSPTLSWLCHWAFQLGGSHNLCERFNVHQFVEQAAVPAAAVDPKPQVIFVVLLIHHAFQISLTQHLRWNGFFAW